MRKASRAMDAIFALEVLDKAPYVTVSFVRPDGTPYGVPMSLARTNEKTFYFHCALEGDKLDCIVANPRVALSAVTRCTPTVGPKDGSFTLQYKSAMAVGKAEIVTDRDEKIEALLGPQGTEEHADGHNAVDRPAEGIPIYRADTQFEHQSRKDKASSDEEAFFHIVGFSPHQISINLPFFLASSIHLGTIWSRNFCFFSFNFCMSRPIAC